MAMHCFPFFLNLILNEYLREACTDIVTLFQFLERVQLLAIPPKHQPDLIFLRHVPLRKVHLFTFIQTACLVILWILKSTVAAIIFPLMLLALVGVRKSMEWFFSLHDLSWLDDILPAKEKIVQEPKKEESDLSDSEDVRNSVRIHSSYFVSVHMCVYTETQGCCCQKEKEQMPLRGLTTLAPQWREMLKSRRKIWREGKDRGEILTLGRG
eukprot:XP_017946217.1 PREDICTED: electrogenic sodium bicarbonate cotransporter 1-like [Xenopus tropicalis]